MIFCLHLKKNADELPNPPYPGELGVRIHRHISKEAWRNWLERLVMIINEYQLNTSKPEHQKIIEKHMVGFLFHEGEQYGQAPQGYHRSTKK